MKQKVGEFLQDTPMAQDHHRTLNQKTPSAAESLQTQDLNGQGRCVLKDGTDEEALPPGWTDEEALLHGWNISSGGN